MQVHKGEYVLTIPLVIHQSCENIWLFHISQNIPNADHCSPHPKNHGSQAIKIINFFYASQIS